MASFVETRTRRADCTFEVDGISVNRWLADPQIGRALIVHGSMDLSKSHRGVATALSAAGYQTDVCDRRGYGATGGEGHEDMGPAVADIVSVIGDGVDVLVGHSHGGTIAMAVAAERPDLVPALVVYEPAYSWAETWDSSYAAEMIELTSSTYDELCVSYAIDEKFRSVFQGLKGDLITLYDRPVPLSLEDLTVPVLFLRGDVPGSFSETAEWLSLQADHFSGLVIEGADHGAHVTHHDHFSHAVVEFLEAL